jgi:hypothetical protein
MAGTQHCIGMFRRDAWRIHELIRFYDMTSPVFTYDPFLSKSSKQKQTPIRIIHPHTIRWESERTSLEDEDDK